MGNLTRLFCSHLWREAAPLLLPGDIYNTGCLGGRQLAPGLTHTIPSRLWCNLNCRPARFILPASGIVFDNLQNENTKSLQEANGKIMQLEKAQKDIQSKHTDEISEIQTELSNLKKERSLLE